MKTTLAKDQLIKKEDALIGRDQAIPLNKPHYVNGNPIKAPFSENLQQVFFGMGCFWGAERRIWQAEGEYSTAVGYIAGYTPNPNYEEVCTGMTGHNEVVLVVFDAEKISFRDLLTIFWESHNPTQGMSQGNDTGTQYRSGIYTTTDEQTTLAEQSLTLYQQILDQAGFDTITTEIIQNSLFYYAENYHQQYLAKNPTGYCGLKGTGISCT